MLTEREREIKRRLVADFEYYAPRCLKIRTKDGSVRPFRLNKAQHHVHTCMETQRRETGRVRVIILKGRQQGISTYIEGRFYWRVTNRRGVMAYILTHEDKATQNLYEMVKRYHDNCPAVQKPSAGASNANELIFDKLDSGYGLGTARSRGTGRSRTLQFFHWSEAAFCANAEEHFAGVMQAVPDLPETEIAIESTAFGIGNLFHGLWQEAEAGRSEYLPIFVPWFWQDEYRKAPPPGFRPTEEEQEYADHHGLSREQLYWMHCKLTDDFRGRWPLFHQEYPATPALAFQFSGHDSFIPAELIMAARKADVSDPIGPVVAGLDPARGGGDRTAIVVRKGRKVLAIRTWADTSDAMGIVGLAQRVQKEFGVVKMFVDSTDGGYGIVDRLNEMAGGNCTWAEKVSFGEGAEEPDKYVNKRAEMWDRMRAWLKDGPVDVPDSDELHADLMAPAEIPPDSHGRTKLQAKKDIKKNHFRSPDVADALALTFAYAVAPRTELVHTAGGEHSGVNAWMAM